MFAGGWTLEAAEAVSPALDLLAWLPQLVNKSLVISDASEGEARYRMLETIRQFAQEKLVESGEADSARQLHAHYFLQFAAEADQKLSGRDMLIWLTRLEAEHDNLRGALGWAVAAEPETALRLAGACRGLWTWHSYETEGAQLVPGGPGGGRPVASGAGGSRPGARGRARRGAGDLGLGVLHAG